MLTDAGGRGTGGIISNVSLVVRTMLQFEWFVMVNWVSPIAKTDKIVEVARTQDHWSSHSWMTQLLSHGQISMS